MFSLRNLLRRPGAVGIFIILELICFLMIIYANDRQGNIFFGFTDSSVSSIQKQATAIKDRFSYKSRYDSLLKKHTELLNQQANMYYDARVDIDSLKEDSLLYQRYVYLSARVIQHTYTQKSNYITINKGRKQGIQPRMSVRDNNGIVGIVVKTSENYSRVISILHNRIRVTVEIKDRNLEGSLVWDEKHPRFMYLEGIPTQHALEIGEEIVIGPTSSKFPPGIPVGKIAEHSIPPGSSTHTIKVELSNDLRRLKEVFVVKHLHLKELEGLEEPGDNE